MSGWAVSIGGSWFWCRFPQEIFQNFSRKGSFKCLSKDLFTTSVRTRCITVRLRFRLETLGPIGILSLRRRTNIPSSRCWRKTFFEYIYIYCPVLPPHLRLTLSSGWDTHCLKFLSIINFIHCLYMCKYEEKLSRLYMDWCSKLERSSQVVSRSGVIEDCRIVCTTIANIHNCCNVACALCRLIMPPKLPVLLDPPFSGSTTSTMVLMARSLSAPQPPFVVAFSTLIFTMRLWRCDGSWFFRAQAKGWYPYTASGAQEVTILNDCT